MFAWAECSWTNRPQHSWTDRPQHSWTDRLPRKDAICHAAPARCWVHPNRDPAFNPPAKAGKLHSAFCSEEEGIPTSNGLFHNAPLGRSPHSPTPFLDRRGGSRRISPSCRSRERTGGDEIQCRRKVSPIVPSHTQIVTAKSMKITRVRKSDMGCSP